MQIYTDDKYLNENYNLIWEIYVQFSRNINVRASHQELGQII